jgi:hypothetical protein
MVRPVAFLVEQVAFLIFWLLWESSGSKIKANVKDLSKRGKQNAEFNILNKLNQRIKRWIISKITQSTQREVK